MAKFDGAFRNLGRKREPIRRRALSVPSNQHAKDSISQRKRARSEACISDGPVRISKRLKGIAPEMEVEEEDTVVLTGGWQLDGKEKDTRRQFGRTLSGATESTEPDEAAEVEMSTQSTVPDDEPLPAIDGAYPASSQLVSQSVNPYSLYANVMEDNVSPSQETIAQPEEVERPPYRNEVPPAVSIDGHPPLRVCWRETCLHRVPSGPLEWRSPLFLAQIVDSTVQADYQVELERDGYITIPSDLFGTVTPEEEKTLKSFIPEILEKYSLPNQEWPTFSFFSSPLTKLPEPRRISWWKTLSDHFHLPHHLEEMFNPTPNDWHTIFHSLDSMALMRDFSETTELLGVKRARELVHQELARRIAFIKGHGKIRPATHFRLIRMDYAELRRISTFYDDLEKEDLSGQARIDCCSMCGLYPALSETRSEEN
jgi:hypothetical protein